MAKMGNRLKIALLKGMEAVGKGASNLASNAHLKVSEINLESRRREILSEFPLRAHDLWQKGVELPQPLGDMMSELNDLDERLSVLRAQRYAKVEEEGAAKEEGEPSAEGDAAQEPAESGDSQAPQTEGDDVGEPADESEPADENESANESEPADAPDAPAEGDNA